MHERIKIEIITWRDMSTSTFPISTFHVNSIAPDAYHLLTFLSAVFIWELHSQLHIKSRFKSRTIFEQCTDSTNTRIDNLQCVHTYSVCCWEAIHRFSFLSLILLFQRYLTLTYINFNYTHSHIGFSLFLSFLYMLVIHVRVLHLIS